MHFEDRGATYQRVKDLKGVFAFDRFPAYAELSSDLHEELGEENLAFLNRKHVDESQLTPDQKFWRKNGYLILQNAIPEELIEHYLILRKIANLGLRPFPNNEPFDSFSQIRDLCLYRPLMKRVADLLGYRVALYVNLSNFTSTERGWHQDDYMYDPHVGASNIAIWFSLGSIHPDCGPFEYIAGSHWWPIMRRDKVTRYLTPEARENRGRRFEFWPQLAEYYVNPACESYIRERNATPEFFLAEKGDVLIWHGGLMHRGSPPHVKNRVRPGLIAHYCDPIRDPARLDGGDVVEHTNGEWYVTYPRRPKLKLPRLRKYFFMAKCAFR